MKNENQYHDKLDFNQEELQRRESVCTRNDPPLCTSRCPINIDVRALCKAVAKGKFSKGYLLLKEATPFVNLIANNCDARCESSCILHDDGKQISVNALERACAEFGASERKFRFQIPKKTAKVAVVGSDLFALAASYDIGKRGYEIDFYGELSDKKDILSRKGLTEDAVDSDLSAFSQLRVNYKQQRIDRVFIEGMIDTYDAICMSSEYNDVICDEKIFVGDPEVKAIDCLANARDISLLLDKFLLGVSSETNQIKENNVETRLFVSPNDIAAAQESRFDTNAPFTEDSAVEEASRCIQCSCEECIRGCVFLQEFKTDPKRMAREIYNNLSIKMGSHPSNKLINSCALCEQCTAICPNDFDVKSICLHARRSMVENDRMPPSTHEFVLLDMAYSNDATFLSRPAPGKDKCKYLFFPGCQATSISPDTVWKTYKDLLLRLDGNVGIMLGCCGAIADWAGNQPLYLETRNMLISEWEKLDKPIVITACPSCHKYFERDTDMTLKGIWDILADGELQKTQKCEEITIHDACGARGSVDIQENIRNIITSLGFTIKENLHAKDSAPCCGFGGLVSYANEELAEEMTRFAATDAHAIHVSYCMACRDRFSKEGFKSRHFLELVYGEDNQSNPDISERRFNRKSLKNKILKQIFSMPDCEEKEYDFTIEIDDTVKKSLGSRKILTDDIYEVLDLMKKNGNRIQNCDDDYELANARIGNVTYWVRYKQIKDGYKILGAYSYRMTVEVL